MNGTHQMRTLLQEFVDVRIDAPELFTRAGQLLPEGTDTSEVILELLAEGDLKLRLPAGRQPFVRRLEQAADGETSFTELDLWCFALGQTAAFAPEAAPSSDPEVNLLQEVVASIQEWEEESARPSSTELRTLAGILAREDDPRQCLNRLEEALARFERE